MNAKTLHRCANVRAMLLMRSRSQQRTFSTYNNVQQQDKDNKVKTNIDMHAWTFSIEADPDQVENPLGAYTAEKKDDYPLVGDGTVGIRGRNRVNERKEIEDYPEIAPELRKDVLSETSTPSGKPPVDTHRLHSSQPIIRVHEKPKTHSQ